MADSTLNEALMGLNVPASENLWGAGASTLGQIAPALINPQGKVGTNLGIGLGSVLLTALMGYQARQTAAEESLTTNKLAQQLMTLGTPEERTSFIEQQKDNLSPRLTGRLLTLGTALQAQEKSQQMGAESQYLSEMAKLRAATSPVGRQYQQMQMDQLTARLGAQFENAKALEGIKQTNRVSLLDRRFSQKQELADMESTMRDAQAKGKMTATETADLADRYGTAQELAALADELENLTEFDAKVSLNSMLGSKLVQARPGLLSSYANLKNKYGNKLFGSSLSGFELQNRDLAFGANTFATKADAVAALRNLAKERLTGANNILAIKQSDIPTIAFKFQQALGGDFQPLSSPVTAPTPTTAGASVPTEQSAKIATINRILDNPNIPEEEKAVVRAELAKLGA